MTPVEIAYFKHFMLDKALIKAFTKYFRFYHIDENPKSIEEYFLKIPAEKVIVNAFYFKMEGKLNKYKETFAYWKKVHCDWKMYWAIMENNHSNESWWKLTGTFDILRQNWDLPDFYLRDRKESSEETYKRLGLEPPYNFTDNNTEVSLTPESREVSIIDVDATDAEDDTDDPFAGIELFDEPQPLNPRLRRGEVSLNFRNKTSKLNINVFDAKDILDGGFKYLRVGKVDDDVCIIFNNISGANVSISSNNKNWKSNVTVTSKEKMAIIKTLLNVKAEYSILHIEKKPERKGLLIYKITL